MNKNSIKNNKFSTYNNNQQLFQQNPSQNSAVTSGTIAIDALENMTFQMGDRIKNLRHEHSLTQKELAKRLGVSTSTVGMYEQNRREPSGDMLIKICILFGISLDFLVSGVEFSLRQKGSYNSESDDLSSIIDDLKDKLKTKEGLMFNGQELDFNDIDAIFDAMKIGAGIAFSKAVPHVQPSETPQEKPKSEPITPIASDDETE